MGGTEYGLYKDALLAIIAIGYEDLTGKERTIENIAAIGYEDLSDPSHTNVIGYEVLLYTESGR